MDVPNREIRQVLFSSGIKHWELAKRYGHSPAWLCVKLRKELTENEKLEMLGLIGEIIDERKVNS